MHHRELVVLLTEIPPAFTDADFRGPCSAQQASPSSCRGRTRRLGQMERDWSDAASAFTAAASATIRDLDAGANDARALGAYVVDCDAGFLPARLYTEPPHCTEEGESSGFY